MPLMENLGFEWHEVRRLGILGGTFDPVHHGHLAAACAACDQMNLDRVLLIPARTPPHKTGKTISASMHRYLMCVLATLTIPEFSVSQIEIQREGPSYTIETIRLLRERVDDATELFTVIGADMVLDIVNWYRPDAILDESTVVGVSRPGFDLQAMEQTLGTERSQKVKVITADTPDLSGTEIRRRVENGQPINSFVPEAVRQYMGAAQLYR